MNVYVNDYNDTVKQYYNELRKTKYSPLSKEEENNLFIEYRKTKNQFIKNKIINSNLRFVFEIAKRHKGLGVSIDELISEGNLGLLKAFDKFDVNKGVKFYSYAVWWITQGIKAYIKETQMIDKIEKSDEELLSPTKKENLFDTEDETLIQKDIMMAHNEEQRKMEESDHNKKVIEHLLSKLDDRAMKIMSLRYGIGDNREKTLEEVGQITNLTKERVRQICDKSLHKLRSEVLVFSEI